MDLIILGQNGELVIEILNSIISLTVLVIAIKLSILMKGGTLSRTVNWIAVGVFVFSVLEVYGLFSGLNVFTIEGLEDLLELVTISSFLFALVNATKSMTRM